LRRWLRFDAEILSFLASAAVNPLGIHPCGAFVGAFVNAIVLAPRRRMAFAVLSGIGQATKPTSREN
jgi:hypothetical protein